MIFVTIGSMFPFDRLIKQMDNWTAQFGADQEVLAQIGTGTYEPNHMPFSRKLTQIDFAAKVAQADLIVAHAGMGSFISAGRAGKPIVLLPRIKDWGEHTTDHQIATAEWLRGKPGVFVADTDADLPGMIIAAQAAFKDEGAYLAPVAERRFTDRLRAEILS